MEWIIKIILVFSALIAVVIAFNVAIDPARVFWRRKLGHPAWVLRGKKLNMLKRIQTGQPVKTLILGDSRIYNLDLINAGFPSPVFNFASTNAVVDDFLASFNLVCRTQTPPEIVVIGISGPAFNEAVKIPLEGYVAGEYTKELAGIGSIKTGIFSDIALLLSIEYFRHSWQRFIYLLGYRKKADKFVFQDDGFASWKDKASEKTFNRQFVHYPFTGIKFNKFKSLSPERMKHIENILSVSFDKGIKVVVLLMPSEHPELLTKIEKMGGSHIYPMITDFLDRISEKYKATFLDWHKAETIGLTGEDFRDAIHLTDEAQRKIAERLYDELAEIYGRHE